ncbi:MAG: hypothetical protein O2840_00975 [bacterium]|nr:hypothetical protein [bacterium]
MNTLKKHFVSLAVLLLLAGLGSIPLFHTGLYTAHDIWHQVARLYHYSTLVSLGEFPPRWVFDLAQGFGYPLFFFSYHFPWFFGSLLVALGLTIADALKLLFVVGYFAAGFNMYWLMYTLTKKRVPSLIAAITYNWSPYFFLAMYVAAAIGTVFTFALLPVLILGLYYLSQNKFVIGSVLLATGLSAALLTHVLTLTLLIPLLGSIWVLGLHKSKERHKYLIWSTIAGILALGLSAFYLLPLRSYLPLIAASTESGGLTNNYTNYFASLKQLVYSSWGFGPIVSDAKQGEISLQVGIAQWLGAVLAVALLVVTTFFYKKELFRAHFSSKMRAALLLYLLLFLLSIYFMLDISQPFWLLWSKVLPLDFPFRLLLMSVFVGSLLIGLGLASLKKTWLQYFLGGSLVMVALYTNRNHVRVNLYTDIPLDLYIVSETTTNTYHEYMPRSADTSVLNQDVQSFIPDEPTFVFSEHRSPTGVTATVVFPENKSIAVRQFAFPGVTVRINGEIRNTQVDDKGRLVVLFPAGKYQVSLSYEKPAIVALSEYISLGSVGILLILILLRKKLK